MPTRSNLSSNSTQQNTTQEHPISLDEEELQSLYTWVDSIPLSRPKKNIARDFADGVLMAEIVKHYFPRLVQLHNYSAASSTTQKMYNWNTLNQKVFKRIHFNVSKAEMKDVVRAKSGTIEMILKSFQQKLTKMKAQQEEEELAQERSPMGKRAVSQQQHHDDDVQQYDQHSMGGGASVRSGTSKRAKSVRAKSQPRSAPREPSMHVQHQQQAPPSAQPQQYFAAPSSQGAVTGAGQDPNNIRIKELQETVKILEAKVNKLNLLLRLKDSKIHALTEKLRQSNVRV